MGDGKTLHDVQQRLHHRYITGVIAACLLLGGCGPRNDAYNPSHFAVHSVVAPPDVAVPGEWTDAAFNFNGLYVETPDALACCWIATQATLYVRKSGPAKDLVAGFWVPNFPVFADGQRVQIALPGEERTAWRDLDANGPTAVTITLPPALRDETGIVPVRIVSEKTLIGDRSGEPSLLGRLLVFLGLRAAPTSSDDRKLGVILRYLYFDSKNGPSHAGTAAAPSAQTDAPFFPAGIVPPASWQAQRREGVWSADTRTSCCFLSKRADVHLTNAAGTQYVSFQIFVPSYRPLLQKPVSLTCAFDGIAAGAPVRLTPGMQNVTFAVPAALRNTPHLTATLETSATWIPADLGLGNDKRELSVMLQRVGYI